MKIEYGTNQHPQAITRVKEEPLQPFFQAHCQMDKRYRDVRQMRPLSQTMYQREQMPYFERIHNLIYESKKQQNDKFVYRRYLKEQKQEIVDLLDLGISVTRLSLLLAIPEKNIRRWKAKGIDKSRKGRGPMDKKMQIELLVEIWKMILKGEQITKSWIMNKALELKNTDHFQASIGWLTKFMRRSNLKQTNYRVRFKNDN